MMILIMEKIVFIFMIMPIVSVNLSINRKVESVAHWRDVDVHDNGVDGNDGRVMGAWFHVLLAHLSKFKEVEVDGGECKNDNNY